MHGELPSRTPCAINPQEQGVQQLTRQLLADQAPDSQSRQGHANAYHATGDGGYQRYLSLCLEVDFLDKEGTRDDSQRVNDQHPADNPHDLHQQRLFEEPADRRGCKEQHNIEQPTDQQVEQENGIVVHPPGIRLANQRIGETAVNNRIGYGNEYREDSHDAVLRRSQQAGQY